MVYSTKVVYCTTGQLDYAGLEQLKDFQPSRTKGVVSFQLIQYVTDVLGTQLAVRVSSLVLWTPMACASNINIVLSFAHLPM